MKQTDLSACFSTTYIEARRRFIASGIAHYCGYYMNPHGLGRFGEALTTDIVRIGPDNAEKLLIVTSGVHGTEGYPGSAIQTCALETGFLNPLPENMAVVLVHALNPYGFSRARRGNENNVDINRNSMDWSGILPAQHPLTAEIQELLLPDEWVWPNRGVEDFTRKHGLSVLKSALLQGHYTIPNGLFYGGQKEEWSTATWQNILNANITPAVRHIAHVDLHTGLGGYGEKTIIVRGPEHAPRARLWFGDAVQAPGQGSASISPALSGPVGCAFNAVAHNADVMTVTLEIGTYPPLQVLEALALDNWVHAKGKTVGPMREEARRKMIEALSPADPAWRHKAVTHGAEVMTQAKKGLELA